MTALLQFYRNEQQVTVPIDTEEFILGRDRACDISLLDDKLISRRHCRIIETDEGYSIEDTSSNGTFLNDQKLCKPTALENNDKIRIGSREFFFYTERRSEIPTQPAQRQLQFCVQCSGSIAFREIDQGLAEQHADGYICSDCRQNPAADERVFGSYILEEKIAQGGFGVIYRARHRILDTVVALKMIREGKDTDPAIIKRFMREIRLGAMIAHPNIIEFLDAGEFEGTKYLVMEYCAGKTIDQILEQGKQFTAAEFIHIARQCLDALAAVHDAELVHRDIKPGNILLTDDHTVKLIDFGLVKSLDVESQTILTKSGSAMGTPHYMPPEQIRTSIEPDIRGDIYSLGATFYRMLCGQPPVLGKTIGEFMRNVAKDDIRQPSELNPDVPLVLNDWIMTSLLMDPDKRFQTAEHMRKAFNAIINI